jgi:hypothetical protein
MGGFFKTLRRRARGGSGTSWYEGRLDSPVHLATRENSPDGHSRGTLKIGTRTAGGLPSPGPDLRTNEVRAIQWRSK